MGHNVGEAADRAVKRSEKVATAKQTSDEAIASLRLNLANNLAIPRHQVLALLTSYDTEVPRLLTVNGELLLLIGQQKEKIDQFRDVYEQENSRQTVKIEREAPELPVDFGATDPELVAALGTAPPKLFGVPIPGYREK